MRLLLMLLVAMAVFSNTSCNQKNAENGFIVNTNKAVPDTLFKETIVDTIPSPITGVKLYSYSATHIDSTYFINFHKATEKEREEYYGPISPSEPNSKDIQYFQFKDAASGANWTKINDTLRYLVMGNSSPEKALMYKDSDF
ncbi:MAG: hypothetical protein RL138_176, partial [Bacteroidota bacterium]